MEVSPPWITSPCPTADSSTCSAITAVGITAALLLHRHQEVGQAFHLSLPLEQRSQQDSPSPQGSIPSGNHTPLTGSRSPSGHSRFSSQSSIPSGNHPLFPPEQHSQHNPRLFPQVVLLPRLMRDFSELLEQLLLRGRAVGFSGQLQALVGHSLRQLQPSLAPHPQGPPRAALGPPEASARAWLGRLAGGVRHCLAGEAVGGEWGHREWGQGGTGGTRERGCRGNR